MNQYMNLPPKLEPKIEVKADPVILPIGTRIRFVKELSSGPDEFSPGNLYAEKDDFGEVTGHGCTEGHWVKWDKWKAPFGATYGTDFVKAEA
jgi:hypothetical protein